MMNDLAYNAGRPTYLGQAITDRASRYAPVPEPDPKNTWKDEAACIGAWQLFTKDNPEPREVREARATCRRCPVLLECGQAAFDGDEHAGIWAGLTERERAHIRGRRRRAEAGEVA